MLRGTVSSGRLTPLAKVLLVLVILGATGAAAWNLGVKEFVEASKRSLALGSTDDPDAAPAPPAAVDPSGVLGSATNPLKVSLVSFHGYAPALVANGSSLRTAPGSIFQRRGLSVTFVIQDDIPTLATIFTSKAAHCAWRTSDFWAQEQPNLRNNKLDARAILVVDNTQGADAIITRNPAIQRVEDLAGQKVALLQYTPSHGMVIDAVENSSLSARRKTQVNYVFINADEGTAGVRAAFESGQVDAAALWDPDLSLALRAVRGARVIYSTKTATNLIYDVIVCDKAVLDNPANTPALQSLVSGWLEGVEVARAKPDLAVDALIQTQEFFALLAKDQGRGFVKELFSNLVWTGVEDNARILGLAGGTNHYERVYRRFDQIYRAAGALANPNSPVINPADSLDTRFISQVLSEKPAARKEAQKPQFEFSAQESQELQAGARALTKPVTVNFAHGSAELTKRAERNIDSELVPVIENNGSAYFELSGNTDSTGTREGNLRLSLSRAQAVVDYLVRQWEFPRERFVVVGNGPDRPLCNEQAPEEGLSLEDCRAANRTTRLAVLVRN